MEEGQGAMGQKQLASLKYRVCNQILLNSG